MSDSCVFGFVFVAAASIFIGMYIGIRIHKAVIEAPREEVERWGRQ